MRSRSATYYEGRVAFGTVSLLPALALPAYAAFLWYHWGTTPVRPGPDLLAMILELGLPLVAAASAAPLMAVEREERFDELRASYPERPWRLPLVRTLGALALSAVSLLITAGLLRRGYGPFDWSQVVWPAAAPTLFLLGLTLLASNVLGNYWAAAGTGLGYWLLDALTRGTLTRPFFLFDHTWPVPDDVYARNRWLLAAGGVVMMLANVCDQVAVDGISLTAGPGVVARLGPNGSGKTTLLRILATVLAPDAGSVAFGGRSYATDPRPVRRVLGYLPQHLDVEGQLTPLGLLRYLAALKGVPADAGLLESLDLPPDRPIPSLSGGELRRLGIALQRGGES